MKYLPSFLLFCVILLANLLIIAPFASGQILSTIVDWDDENIGSYEGATGQVTYWRSGGDNWEIGTNYPIHGSAPYALEMESHRTTTAFPNDDENDRGYINLTSTYDYINQIQVLGRFFQYKSNNFWGDINLTFFNNSIEILSMGLYVKDTDSPDVLFWVLDDNGVRQKVNDNQVITAVEATWKNITMEVTHVSGNLMNFSFYYSDGVTLDLLCGKNLGIRTSADWATFDQILVSCLHEKSAGSPNRYIAYTLDDIIIDTDDSAQTNKSLTFNFFDLDTSNPVNILGGLYPGAPGVNWEGRAEFQCSFLSNAQVSAINYENWGTSLTVYSTWDAGTWGEINFTDAFMNTGIGSYKFYGNYEIITPLIDGLIFNVFFSEQDVTDEYTNGKSMDLGGGAYIELWTDKEHYGAGETIGIKYRLPRVTQLENAGFDGFGWQIWVYNDNYRYLWVWETHGWQNADAYFTDLIYDNQYHYEYFDAPVPTNGSNHYKLYVAKNGDWWDEYLIRNPIHCWVHPDSYTPTGNITAISPANPVLGQEVTITWNASNRGVLFYRKASDPPETLNSITMFQRGTANKQCIHQFYEIGYYELVLQCRGMGQLLETVDRGFYFWVNGTGTQQGEYGYGIEYLIVEPYYAIAGNTTMSISYHTLTNNTELEVNDSRGQKTFFGTLLSTNAGTHTFALPNWASIGRWNVTLYANQTLNSSFLVVAEENNHVEFTDHVFYNYDYQGKVHGEFSLWLRHDRPVWLIFKKNGIPEGRKIYLDADQQPNGRFDIPYTDVNPTVGSWTVELWESNNLIKIRLLASDSCRVRQGTITKEQLAEPGLGNIFAMLAQGAEIFGGGEYGLAFMALLMTVAFMFIIESARSKSKKGSSDITFLIGCASFLFWAYIGWLPVWLVLLCILMTAMVFGEWLQKKIHLGG